MHTRSLTVVAVLALGQVPASQADTLMIDAVSRSANMDRPSKGQSMRQVETQYGTPRETIPAVGQPPITRWVYNGFTVYFEGDIVLHAVAER